MNAEGRDGEIRTPRMVQNVESSTSDGGHESDNQQQENTPEAATTAKTATTTAVLVTRVMRLRSIRRTSHGIVEIGFVVG